MESTAELTQAFYTAFSVSNYTLPLPMHITVAIGYDDEEVWMEPRALRAILTGYSFASTERINRATTDRLSKVFDDVDGPDETMSLTTEAHDRIGKHILNLRHRCSTELLEHKSVNVGTVLRHAQLSKTGRWLDNYQNFAIFAAI
ncbi:hypothetical protein CF326_g8265 [Tilletia indica]|nr:hypothetical protein CF326_g8265 [Tilletia indica]